MPSRPQSSPIALKLLALFSLTLCCLAPCDGGEVGWTLLATPAGKPVPSLAERPPDRSQAAIASLGLQGIARTLKRLANRPLVDRLRHWSGLFLKTPYWIPPEAGEGGSSPPGGGILHLEVRWVDCESFVEQTMALALSRRPADISRHIQRIRYHGGIPEPELRHFTVVKGWLAQNRAAGYLRDITRQVGGALTRQVEKDLTPSLRWRPVYLQRLTALGVRAPRGMARIDHIPIETAVTSQRGRLLGKIPSGTLVHLVSAPHEGSPYLVTHVGFVFQTSRGPVFRHASQTPHRRQVEDRPLAAYLNYVARTPGGPEMRTAMGIHLSEITAPKAP